MAWRIARSAIAACAVLSGLMPAAAQSVEEFYAGRTVTLIISFGAGGLNVNQLNVATSLNNFFNGGGTLTPNFLSIFGLTGGNLGAALSQLSGEAATDGQTAAFQLLSDGHGGPDS